MLDRKILLTQRKMYFLSPPTLGKSADFQPTKSSRPRNTLRARSKGSQGRSMT